LHKSASNLDKGWRDARLDLVDPDLACWPLFGSKELRELFEVSPIERTRRKREHRNVAIAVDNSGDARSRSNLKNGEG
jgi:epoxyqueuosine reductase